MIGARVVLLLVVPQPPLAVYMDSLCRPLAGQINRCIITCWLAAVAFSYMLNGAKQDLQTLCHIGHSFTAPATDWIVR
jgi:hypothetical protein